jgi:glycerol kinase
MPGHELPRGVGVTDEEKRKNWFVGSIDCGTTSSRFIIFDAEGDPVSSYQIEFENIYPESGQDSLLFGNNFHD